MSSLQGTQQGSEVGSTPNECKHERPHLSGHAPDVIHSLLCSGFAQKPSKTGQEIPVQYVPLRRERDRDRTKTPTCPRSSGQALG